MNNIRFTLAVAFKELQVMSKDRGNLAILFLLPLLLSSLLGSVFSATAGVEEGEEAAIVLDVFLVNEDTGSYGEQVVRALKDIDQLRILTQSSVALADEKMADGEALAAIIIPADFSQKIDAYEPTQVQVIVDPTKEVASSIVSGIVNQVVGEVETVGEISYGISSVFDESGVLDGASQEIRVAAEAQTLGAIMTQLQEMRQSPVISVRSEALEGAEEEGPGNVFGYVIPNFTVMFAFFLIGVIAATLLREKEEGSLRRLIAAPLPRGTIILGKMLAYMLIIVLQVVILFGVGNIAFDMPLGDSVLGLLVLTLVLALASSALGMLLAAWAKTSSQADSAGTILGFILAGLGGCIVGFPEDSFMGQVALITPHGHAVRGFYALLNDGSGLADILPNIIAVAGFAVVFFLVAVWRFRFE